MSPDIRASTDRGEATLNGVKIQIPGYSLLVAKTPGSNGAVFRAWDEALDREVAVKVWVPRKADRRDRQVQALQEARKIAGLRHDRIPAIHRVGQLENGWIYMVMDYLKGPTLREFLGHEAIDLADRLEIWRSVADVLRYAHERDVFHGDLHLGNILLLDADASSHSSLERRIRVFDFGTSAFASTRLDSLRRESRLLAELTQKLFPEWSLWALLRKQTDQLDPRSVLVACNAWVNLVTSEEEITRGLWFPDYLDEPNPDRALEALKAAARHISDTPCFDINNVESWLRARGAADKHVAALLALTVAYAKHSILPYPSTGYPLLPETRTLLRSGSSSDWYAQKHLDKYRAEYDAFWAAVNQPWETIERIGPLRNMLRWC